MVVIRCFCALYGLQYNFVMSKYVLNALAIIIWAHNFFTIPGNNLFQCLNHNRFLKLGYLDEKFYPLNKLEFGFVLYCLFCRSEVERKLVRIKVMVSGLASIATFQRRNRHGGYVGKVSSFCACFGLENGSIWYSWTGVRNISFFLKQWGGKVPHRLLRTDRMFSCSRFKHKLTFLLVYELRSEIPV